MFAFIVKRVLWFIPTILAIAAVTFVVMNLTPGSPFQPAGANNLRQDIIEQIERPFVVLRTLFRYRFFK